MKKILIVLLVFILAGCGSVQANKNWGSFTPDKTFSYDNKYYALQTVEKREDASYIVVDIYLSETEEKIYSFSPARASDFWGICWESDTYNIWIQSADIGVLCYRFEDNIWKLDNGALRPEDIKPKYDK